MAEEAETTAPPELSVVVELAKVARNERHLSIEANSDERTAIAKRFGIPSVESLSGEVSISANAEKISLKGVVRATLTRECVASLEPLVEEIEDPFDLEFLRQETPAEDDEIGAAGEDWLDQPETWSGDEIDVGEIVVQQVSLAMNPFPRKENAENLADAYGAQAESSPFAALKNLAGDGESQG